MGMKNIWRNMMERPTTSHHSACAGSIRGLLRYLYLLLWGLQMKTNGFEYNWHVTLWPGCLGHWGLGTGPTIQYLLPQIKMTQHPISIFILLDFLRPLWSFGTLEKLPIMLQTHFSILMASSIWWKDEVVIILWYFDLWWMEPEIERWLRVSRLEL